MGNNLAGFIKSVALGLCISIFTFATVLDNPYAAYEEKTNNKVLKEIDGLVDKYDVQGASVALIQNGEVTEYRNYGVSNIEEKTPVTNKTVFKIASISKTVTAYGIMKLVDEKKLDLDVPISTYLKRWQLPDTEFDEDKVTLRTLLSHTSGVTDSSEQGYTEPLPDIATALERRNVHLKREPGTEFEYSSFAGLGICQLIIEEVTGERFEDYMKSQIFEPLGMESANYGVKAENGFVMATPYAGFHKAVEPEQIVMNGAGGVNIDNEDFTKFVINLMDYYDGGNLEMFQAQPATGSIHGVYGLGIIPTTLENGKTIYHHNGTLTGWNAEFAFEPKSKSGIVILTNSDKGFYFTYEALGEWSREAAGGITLDTADVFKMENGIKIAIIIVSILLGLLAIEFIYKLRKNKITLVKGKKKIVVSLIKSIIALVVMIAWYIGFYTAIPFEIMYSMKNYYLFTFFTTNFQILSAVIMVFLLVIAVRVFYRKTGKELKNGKSNNGTRDNVQCR